MLPKSYLQSFAANVVKRSGINLPTVMAVLPHVFDEIRFQLTEGTLCVPIESFGTFSVIKVPERQRLYSYKLETPELHTLPATMRLKFRPTRSFKEEIAAQQYDPTRQSFTRHRDDRPIRKRRNMRYNKRHNITIEHVPEHLGVPQAVDAYEHIDLAAKREEQKQRRIERRKLWKQQHENQNPDEDQNDSTD